MANFNSAICFRVCSSVLWWLIFSIIWMKTVGETVHIMSVTTNPYGASQSALSGFSCLLSDPDTNQLTSIDAVRNRHVMRGSMSPNDTLSLPAGTKRTADESLNKLTVTLPQGIESQGVYYCEASNNGLTTRVPIIILANDRRFEPSNGQFTVTASVGEPVTLTVDVIHTPLSYLVGSDTRWERQGDRSDAFEVVQNGGDSLTFHSVSVTDAGVYATYWKGLRNEFQFSLIRLIVRECIHGRWGPPSCVGICDNCYNGGICDDKTGECVCRPGFTGPNCLTACEENNFGWHCDHQCGAGLAVSSCIGSVFCMPDPVGCSCMAGYRPIGKSCNEGCPNGKFGAGCTEDCNCAAGFCDGVTGECQGGCTDGWSGTSCQIPNKCGDGYYGSTCVDKCNCQCDQTTGSCAGATECLTGFYGTNCDMECHCQNCDRTTGCVNVQCFDGFWGPNCEAECHCLNGVACDSTGKCNVDTNTGLALCEPGYVSSTGVSLDDCQQHEGCYAGCTKTCHCALGNNQCTETGVCLNQGCQQGWTGPYCQSGIVELTYVKTNPGQLLNVTCTVTGDPDVPTLRLVYTDAEAMTYSGKQLQIQELGMYLTVWFEAGENLPKVNGLICLVYPVRGGESASAMVTPTYYDLPEMGKPPSKESVGTTSVSIQWNAWGTNDGDSGDGPVVAYRMYYRELSTEGEWMSGFAPHTLSSVLMGFAQFLQPDTTYTFYVTAVREGEGGEGPPSPEVKITTLPSQPPLPTTTTAKIVTTPPPSTTPPPPSTTTLPSTTTPSPTAPPSPTKPPSPTMSPSKTTVPPSTTPMKPITEKPTAFPEKPVGRTTTNKVATVEHTSEPNDSPGFTHEDPTQQPASATSKSVGNSQLPIPSNQQTQPIIVAVIVALVCILMFVIALVWFLRRKKNQLKRYPPSVIASEADLDRLSSVFPDSSVATMVETQSISTLGSIDNLGFDMAEEKPEIKPRPKSNPPPISTETPPTLRRRPKSAGVSTDSIKIKLRIPPVNIKDYANYVKAKRETTDLIVEWESLPKDLARPTTIAKKSENKGKNRYRNVVAYDHSRVMLEPLEDDPDSDYINACYIKGIRSPKAYIATQGPNDMTIGDYWRLVWQKNISVMVMACNVLEEGKLKCAKYWPDKDTPLVSNGITVTLNSEEQREDYYIVRKFIISKEGEDETRKLLQFHYTSWPDKDVPKHCTPVLKFIKDVNGSHDRKTPLLIHCSAGAGRTGAIIAIHGMMDLADEKGQVDIYNFVFSMRNSRPNIVQTASQYIFVHDAMLEYIFCKNTFIEASMFASKLKALQEQNPESGMTYLQDEYEILNLVSPNFDSERIRGSTREDSIAKIRSGDTLAVDSSRPYLMTQRDDGDMSPYINAAYMDGYKKKDLFISTQTPMANTVVDLWRMMYDYNCTSIVMLNAMEPDDEDCPQFWPDAGTGEYGPFRISLLDKESTPDFEMKTLQLVYTKRAVKSPIPVRHFQYTTWPNDDERPASSHGILQLISAVEKWQKTLEEPGPIVVLCMNAAGRSGTFCTIQTALDQVREEQGVDVLQNVKQLRIHRTNMVDTAAKYLFCYTTILEYLKAFDDYSSKKNYQNVSDFSKPKEEEEKEEMKNLYGNIPSIGEQNLDTNKASTNSKPTKSAKPVEASTPSAESHDVQPNPERGTKPPIKEKPTPPSKPLAKSEGTPTRSRKDGKTSAKKSTKKTQEQLYQNVIFDTQL